MSYQLSVIKTLSCEYLVNFHPEKPYFRMDNFKEVVALVCGYAEKPEIFEKEPALSNLSKQEKEEVECIRELVLRQAPPPLSTDLSGRLREAMVYLRRQMTDGRYLILR